MLRDHGVFGRGQVDAEDGVETHRRCLSHHFVEHCLFHVALKHTATHEPQIEVQGTYLSMAEHDRNETVVAEAVAESAVEGDA